MNSRALARACVAAADEFVLRRLWRRFRNGDLLAFEVPGQPPLVGSIMGAGGDEHGLILLQGAQALDDFLAMINKPTRSLSSPMLSLSLERTVAIEPPFDRVLEMAERKGRTAPLFLAKDVGMQPRPPHRAEFETLLFVLRGLLVADAQGRLRPDGFAESRLLPLLRISGDPLAPGVMIRLATIAGGEPQEPPEIALPADLVELPRLDTTYAVGVDVVPAVIEGESQELRALVVVEPASGRLVGVEALLGSNLDAPAAALFAKLRGDGRTPPGLPARIVFANAGLYAALQAGFVGLGVPCEHQASVPALESALSSVDEWFGARTRGATPAQPPAPDDLEAWKALDLELTERLRTMAFDSAMASDRAWRRYFGCTRDEMPLDDDDRGDAIHASYVHWFVFDWRATPRSRTVAARAREEAMSMELRTLLDARSAARPSLYQVRAIEPGASVELVDVQSGREVCVTDKSLSLSAVVELVFFACVYPAGSFHFITPLGPPFPAALVEEVLEFLQREHRLEACTAVPAEASHVLGRLWEWLDMESWLDRLRLSNTDGEALVWVKVRFRVADAAALEEALGTRGDVEVDEPASRWTWCRGELHLGTLELFGSELLLQVNSRERCHAAREWLEQIEGVAVELVEESDVDPRRDDAAPIDDRLPAAALPDDPLGVAEVQRLLNRAYSAWLDQRIPALGNRTPREACMTAAGKLKVARLIRTYPDPTGMPGLVVPRAEMMRELGLEDEQHEA